MSNLDDLANRAKERASRLWAKRAGWIIAIAAAFVAAYLLRGYL